MPELPEVELVVRGLLKEVKGLVCLKWDVFEGVRTLRDNPFLELKNWNGCTILDIRRKGKYIIFDFDKAPSLISHLRMTGSWKIRENLKKESHDCLFCELSDGRFLFFNDVRTFGTLTDLLSPLEKLGWDALNDLPDKKDDFYSLLTCFSRPLKSFLMDQKRLSGLGNIYVNEALFRSRLSPFRLTSSLSYFDSCRLCENIVVVLNDSIRCGGSTIRDYVGVFGEKGGFSQKYFVYGREGGKCLICDTLIQKVNFCGRGTFFCMCCQSVKEGGV